MFRRDGIGVPARSLAIPLNGKRKLSFGREKRNNSVDDDPMSGTGNSPREWRPTVQRETVVVVFHFAMRPKFLKSAVFNGSPRNEGSESWDFEF